MMTGIAYLHHLDPSLFSGTIIIHHDIKTDNLLLDRLEDTPDIRVKINDFDLAVEVLQSKGLSVICGKPTLGWTPEYVAPERYREKHIEPKSDVYSAGLVLWELATGERLVRSEDEICRGSCNAFKNDKPHKNMFSFFSFNKKEPVYSRSLFFGPIINRCIKKAIEKRPSSEEALELLQQIKCE